MYEYKIKSENVPNHVKILLRCNILNGNINYMSSLTLNHKYFFHILFLIACMYHFFSELL